jgi:hypothetical protein
VEAHNAERLAIEQKCLVLERRRSTQEDKRLEMEMACMEIEWQWADNMWQLSMFAQAPFVQGTSGRVTQRELEGVKQLTEVEKGAEVDDEDEDAQGEEE